MRKIVVFVLFVSLVTGSVLAYAMNHQPKEIIANNPKDVLAKSLLVVYQSKGSPSFTTFKERHKDLCNDVKVKSTERMWNLKYNELCIVN